MSAISPILQSIVNFSSSIEELHVLLNRQKTAVISSAIFDKEEIFKKEEQIDELLNSLKSKIRYHHSLKKIVGNLEKKWEEIKEEIEEKKYGEAIQKIGSLHREALRNCRKLKEVTHQAFLVPKMAEYLRRRGYLNLNEIRRGICHGLSLLFCCHHFLDREEEFFNRISSAINTDIKKFEGVSEQSTYKGLKEEKKEEWEHLCNDIIFLHGKEPAVSRQSRLEQIFKIISPSDDSVIGKLRPQFYFASYFRRDKESGSFKTLEETLAKILTGDTDRKKALLLGSGGHVVTVFYRDKTFYCFDASADFRFDPISMEDPDWAKKIVDNFTKYKEADGFSIIITALSDSELREVQNIMEDLDLDLGEETKTAPIHLAAIKGSVSLLDFLYKKGADLDQIDPDTGATPLILALDHDNIEAVKFLLEKGVDVNRENDNGIPPLIIAIHRSNNVNLVKTLLENSDKIDLSRCPIFSKTAIEHAIDFNNREIVGLLIDKGVPLDEKSELGNTPLTYSIRRNNVEMVKFLLERGADVNEPDSYGETPLIHAIKNGGSKIFELLSGSGADVNKSGQYGYTPLIWAIKENRVGMLKSLIEQGADINKPDNSGKTPSAYAKESGNAAEILEILSSLSG